MTQEDPAIKIKALMERNIKILSKKQKVLYLMLFFAGIICAYQTLFPISIAIACTFLFKKKNYKMNILGLTIITYQIIIFTTFLLLQLDIQGLY